MMWKYIFVLFLIFPSVVLALEPTPTAKQIEHAKMEGKIMAEEFGQNGKTGIEVLTAFMSRYEFGSGGICGSGTITTKLKNIVLASYLKAKEGKELEAEAVQEIINKDHIEVDMGSCYKTPEHLGKDHLVLKQNGKDIQPQKIEQTSKLALSGMHVNSISAEFDPQALNSQEPCTVVLKSANGEELAFEVDLTAMP